MKVCFVNALFFPFRGGTENHMLELGEALVKKGVEVHVVTAWLKGTKKRETVRGIKVHRIPAKVVRIEGLYPPPLVLCPNFLKYVRKIDEKENFDLFHLHGRWFPDFTLVRKYCEQTGKQLVLTVHNARPTGINPFYTAFGSAYEVAVGIPTLKSANHLIAVSKWTRNDVAKYAIPKKRFTVIYNGINPGEFTTKHNQKVKKELGIHPSSPLLVWVGRVIEQKGLRYLISALPTVLKQFPTAKLLIIGTGTEVKNLKKQATKLGVSGVVIFYGAVNDRKKLNDLLCGCDLFVFPSVWEPFGMVITEAMASGLPVVASRVGGIPEIVNKNTGFLVPPRSAKVLAKIIITALGKRNLKQIGLRGRKLVEKKFNWRKIAGETIQVYTNVLTHKRKRVEREQLVELYRTVGKQLKKISGKKLKGYIGRVSRIWKETT